MPSDMPVARGGSQTDLRAANRALILDALRRSGTLIQADLARVTGLSAATVSTLVRSLEAEGVVHLTGTVSSGRRARAVSLNGLAGIAGGIDFGRRHVRVTLSDLAHNVKAEKEVQIEPKLPASAEIDIAADVFNDLLTSVAAGRGDVVGVGVGIPGPIDVRNGQVGSGSILPEWIGINPASVVGERLGVQVAVDNDANLGALAELTWGAAKGHDDVVYVKIASGIGAGLVMGGKLHRGHIGVAGEIGHLTMDEDGQVCRCGNRGCLETVASVAVVLELLRKRHGPGVTVGEVVQHAVDGDVASARVIGDIGRHVGVAIANVCNLLNPSMVVVGGSLTPAGDILMSPLKASVERFAIPSVGVSTQVVGSTLGRRAESWGAVALALRAFEYYGPDTAMSSKLDDKDHSGVH